MTAVSNLSAPVFELQRNPHGQLVYTGADGVAHTGVVPVRAFPIAAPDDGLSLLGPDGHELCWIERLSTLPEPARSLLQAELAQREFFPEIESIQSVSSFSTPSTWAVQTARGATSFVLKGEEDIRRLADGALLIASSHGVQFMVRDMGRLDRHSRNLLGRFL